MPARPSLSAQLAETAMDLRIAARRMRRAPALAAGIVLTIGLGLGGAAAIFATSDAALVEPLPYANPERLVHLWERRAGTEERTPTSYPTLLDWRSRAPSFSALEGYDPSNLTIGIADEARMLRGARVTTGFFQLLGVPMASGRGFLPDDEAVAIVSDRFARSTVGSRALGQTITINGAPHVIVGTTPATFHFALLQDADVFVPLGADARRGTDRAARSLLVIGRLRDQRSVDAARAELAGVMAELAREHPDALSGRTIAAATLRDALLGNMKVIMAGLLGAVALLLLIMGANLALLMLSQYLARLPELALRSALGATRARVLRQLVVEGIVPSLAGAALAVAIGQVTTHALLAAIPDGVRIGMPYLATATLDAKVIAMIVGVAIMLAIGFGLGPAVLVPQLRARAGDGRTTLARVDRRLRQLLVVAQLALTVVLLVASALLVVSFGTLVRRDLGIRDPETLVTARAPLSGPRYAEASAQQRFYDELLARTAELPGVSGAGAIDEVPGGGGGATTFVPVDRPRSVSQQPRALLRIVAGDYFRTMGVPLVAGRVFDTHDDAGTQPVAVVSAAFASLLGLDGATVGRRVRLAETGDTEWEVVGVVGDVQVSALDTDAPPVVYLSHRQRAENRLTLVLRTGLGAGSMTRQLRELVKDLAPGVPVYAVSTLGEQLRQSKAVFNRRFPMILCGVFAAAALALTLVALYATCLHDVLTRRREFGIRLALGAAPGSIRRLILADALRLSAAGIGVGVVGAAVVTRSMRAVLFGITAGDWRVYATVTAVVLASSLLATLGPVRRAASVDLGIVLRAE